MITTTLTRNQMAGESQRTCSNPALSAIFATFGRIGTMHSSEFFQLRKKKIFLLGSAFQMFGRSGRNSRLCGSGEGQTQIANLSTATVLSTNRGII